jgi:hypothetical protein
VLCSGSAIAGRGKSVFHLWQGHGLAIASLPLLMSTVPTFQLVWLMSSLPSAAIAQLGEIWVHSCGTIGFVSSRHGRQKHATPLSRETHSFLHASATCDQLVRKSCLGVVVFSSQVKVSTT